MCFSNFIRRLAQTRHVAACCVSIVLAFVFLFAVPASAFTPDDEELAALVKGNFGALSSWEAEMTFPAYSGSKVHVWYARGRWRQEWRAGDTSVAVGKGGNVVAKCTAGDFALSPLFVWMPPDPVESWRSWGVDNATRGYGFCDDKPCFMLGSEFGDESSPSIRLNNEDFSPILFRYSTSVGLTTVNYSDYRTLGGFRVPQKVVVSVGDELLEIEIDWIAVNRADGEELYARDSIDEAPCAMPPTPFDILRDSFRYPSVN